MLKLSMRPFKNLFLELEKDFNYYSHNNFPLVYLNIDSRENFKHTHNEHNPIHKPFWRYYFNSKF